MVFKQRIKNKIGGTIFYTKEIKMKDNDLMKQYNSFEDYVKFLTETYGHTKEQWDNYIKKTHTPEIQSKRGSKNTPEQQSIKGKKSGEIRRKGSAELLQPWIELGISRAWYYKQKKLGLI